MAAPTSRAAGAVWALLHQHPDLLLEHAQAYADLLRDESAAWAELWLQKLLWYTGAVLLAAVGLTLVGVALMLSAALPVDMAAGMSVGTAVLVVVPAGTLLAAALCWWAARRGPVARGVSQVRVQWEADRHLFSREAQ